jgi:two-component system, NarL family, sensor histidine kinase EvgS
MKRLFSLKIFIFFTLLCSYLFALEHTPQIILTQEQKTYLEQNKSVTICIDPLWKPIAFINSEGEHAGIAADMMALLSQKTTLKFELVNTSSWKESIEFSKNKKCDILSFANKTPNREQWLIFTDIILEEPNILIGREDHPMVDDLHKIKDAKIALIKSTGIYERTYQDFPKLTILGAKSESESLEWVKDKKADLTLGSLLITKFMIQKGEFTNLKILNNNSIYTDYLRLGVQKDNPILRDILDKGIRAITPKEHEAIIDKYVYTKVNNSLVQYKHLIYIFAFIGFTALIVLAWNYTLRKKITKAIAQNKTQSQILFQQSKQAELGNMIANISHQWRDSLTKISYINLTLRAKIAKKDFISEDFLDKSTQDIETSIDFMSETMQNFLDYYKPSLKVTKFNIADSIKSSALIIDTTIKNQNLVLSFEGELDTQIEGIKNEWMQIWINIINNIINIAIKRQIQAPHIQITILPNTITFQDNCGGIDTDVLDDFKQEKYTGLGLKICKDIATKNQKKLCVQNTKEGALFSICTIS